MGAPKPETYAIQELSLENVRSDPGVQSRAVTSVEYMREFSLAMLGGDVFPPVVVFFDGQVYWLADGFHRHGAARRAALTSIRAVVRYGTRRDAMIYSAGANWRFSIPRKPEDIQRAAELLFQDKEWTLKTTTEIADHLHASFSTVRRHRLAFHERTGIPLPEVARSSDGRRVRLFRYRGIVVHWDDARKEYRAKIEGQVRRLGKSRNSALREVASLLGPRRGELLGSDIFTLPRMAEWLASRRIHAELTPRRIGNRSCPHRVRGLTTSWADLTLGSAGTVMSDDDDAAMWVGRAVLLRGFLRERAKPSVILTYNFPDDLSAPAFVCGVRVMTPEEFVAETETPRPPEPEPESEPEPDPEGDDA